MAALSVKYCVVINQAVVVPSEVVVFDGKGRYDLTLTSTLIAQKINLIGILNLTTAKGSYLSNTLKERSDEVEAEAPEKVDVITLSISGLPPFTISKNLLGKFEVVVKPVLQEQQAASAQE